jgi:hypothetical protein
VGGKVHHAIDVAFAEYSFDERSVAYVSDEERRVADGLTKARDQIVDYYYLLATRAQLLDYVATYVACTSRD